MAALTAHEPWRHERKFMLPPDGVEAAALALSLGPLGFRKAYPDRMVNSLYLEDPGRTHARAHMHGHPSRYKLRVRWYGPLRGRVADAVLEVKQRRGPVGRKLRYALPEFLVGGRFGTAVLQRTLERAGLPREVLEACRRSPLLNYSRYLRSYYAAAAGRLRVTLDRGLSAAPGTASGAPPRRLQPLELSLLELKYAPSDTRQASRALQGLPLRLVQNSKYLTGLAACFD